MEACTALSRRIAWCERMMQAPMTIRERRESWAEYQGLMGVVDAYAIHSWEWKAYERGLSDRATLLKLEQP